MVVRFTDAASVAAWEESAECAGAGASDGVDEDGVIRSQSRRRDEGDRDERGVSADDRAIGRGAATQCGGCQSADLATESSSGLAGQSFHRRSRE